MNHRNLLIVYTIVAAIVLASTALARNNGQWTDADPELRNWFKSQKSPKNGVLCCDMSDGVYAEEDIRDGKYWTRFVIVDRAGRADPITVDWMEVPDDVVIRDANRHGAPVVWFMMKAANGKFSGVEIRCYAPGGGF